jgi:hypothetical protein
MQIASHQSLRGFQHLRDQIMSRSADQSRHPSRRNNNDVRFSSPHNDTYHSEAFDRVAESAPRASASFTQQRPRLAANQATATEAGQFGKQSEGGHQQPNIAKSYAAAAEESDVPPAPSRMPRAAGTANSPGVPTETNLPTAAALEHNGDVPEEHDESDGEPEQEDDEYPEGEEESHQAVDTQSSEAGAAQASEIQNQSMKTTHAAAPAPTPATQRSPAPVALPAKAQSSRTERGAQQTTPRTSAVEPGLHVPGPTDTAKGSPEQHQSTTPNNSALTEQALKLEAWERELRERERQLLEYRDSLSRPLGAHRPPRASVAAPATHGISSYDTVRQSQESQSGRYESSSYRSPEIHIHNHIPPLSAAPAGASQSPPAAQAPMPTTAQTSVSADGRARFPYDRVEDYDSALPPLASSDLPSFPYEYTALRSGEKAPSGAAPASRPTYSVEPAAPRFQPDALRASFVDRHQLNAHMSYEYPTYREHYTQPPRQEQRTGAQYGAAAVSVGQGSATEEVDLSGLSLAVRTGFLVLCANNVTENFLFCYRREFESSQDTTERWSSLFPTILVGEQMKEQHTFVICTLALLRMK